MVICVYCREVNPVFPDIMYYTSIEGREDEILTTQKQILSYHTEKEYRYFHHTD